MTSTPVPRTTVPRIKVCGLRQLADLDILVNAGVDSIGINFVPSSPRYVEPACAVELSARAAELGLLRVAVVMDLSAAKLRKLLTEVEVDWVQLHGSEPPALADACGGLPILKVTSWTGRPQESELVNAWLRLANPGPLRAWLVDAYAPAVGGGTGRIARWDLLHPRPAAFGNLPLILAGGLAPHNVADAIAASAADGVDTASGVELAPGLKSPDLVRAFAAAAAQALSRRAAAPSE
ncbi:MAG: phosphoribosylanthranilate isomerase [Pirellulaceae bacterium]